MSSSLQKATITPRRFYNTEFYISSNKSERKRVPYRKFIIFGADNTLFRSSKPLSPVFASDLIGSAAGAQANKKCAAHPLKEEHFLIENLPLSSAKDQLKA
jgi:hypothetical protein